jgi:hypothetical protein
MTRYLIGLALLLGGTGIHAPLFAQDSTAKIEAFRKQNRIRSIETDIPAKLKDVDARFAKKEILKETDSKTGKTTQKEVINYRQQPIYDKGMLVHKELFAAFQTEKNPDAKIAKGEAVLAFLNKMIALYGKDTEKLEKQLKKEKDTAKIKALIEKGI